jgi:hypothetical protein
MTVEKLIKLLEKYDPDNEAIIDVFEPYDKDAERLEYYIDDVDFENGLVRVKGY